MFRVSLLHFVSVFVLSVNDQRLCCRARAKRCQWYSTYHNTKHRSSSSLHIAMLINRVSGADESTVVAIVGVAAERTAIVVVRCTEMKRINSL
jgi:hypothetical protein